MFPLFTLSIIVDYSIAEIEAFVIKRKWIAGYFSEFFHLNRVMSAMIIIFKMEASKTQLAINNNPKPPQPPTKRSRL